MNLNTFNKDTNLSPVTIENYIKFARAINIHIDNVSYLNDVELIKKVIAKITTNITSQRNYYSAIVKYLRLTNVDDKIIEKYTVEITNISKKVRDLIPELKDKLKNINYNQKVKEFIKKLEDKDFRDLTINEFMLSLYVLLPPRRLDYINMIYTTDKSVINNTEHNYLYQKGRSWLMVFNKYKTSKTYGQQKFFLNVKTDSIIRTILKRRTELIHGKFIYQKQERQFRKDINKITLEVFGVQMNVQDLRVMYSTHKFKDTKEKLEELKTDSEKMGHSVATKLQNYIR